MSSQEKVLALRPDARLTNVPVGAGEVYGRTRWHYHIWHPSGDGRIETLAMVECHGKSEASAWKAALAHLKAEQSKRPSASQPPEPSHAD